MLHYAAWLWDEIGGHLIWAVFALVGGFVYTRSLPRLKSVWRWCIGFFRKQDVADTAATKVKKPMLDGMGVWFLVLAIVMLAFWNRKLESQTRRLHVEMVRYVLPRRLSDSQIGTIADVLSHADAHPLVEIREFPNDGEAGGFAADIQTALQKGGWPVSARIPDKDTPEGLSLRVEYPDEPEPSPRERLNLKPSVTEVLRQAFEKAHVQFNGGVGTGSGSKSLLVTISVGRRRRDSFGVLPEWWGKSTTPTNLDDDDF
jgi:hypothetical protein